jgi:NAD(P)-dependent dehydrogenase (short-subunit alcohol dehydrogenase family)
MRHVLVVGGSGMLAGLCERLARDNFVSVVGRDPARLRRLADRAPGRISPIAIDYCNSQALAEALEGAAARHGRPDCTVCWAHDDEVVLQVSDHVAGDFWHVLSSAAADPARPEILECWRERFCPGELNYRQVVLGFHDEAASSRWLSDAEISDGVWQAMQGGEALAIVGTVSPWSRRP